MRYTAEAIDLAARRSSVAFRRPLCGRELAFATNMINRAGSSFKWAAEIHLQHLRTWMGMSTTPRLP